MNKSIIISGFAVLFAFQASCGGLSNETLSDAFGKNIENYFNNLYGFKLNVRPKKKISST